MQYQDMRGLEAGLSVIDFNLVTSHAVKIREGAYFQFVVTQANWQKLADFYNLQPPIHFY